MLRLAAERTDGPVYACGRAARISPRLLAGAVIVAVFLVTSRFQDAPGFIGSTRIRLALWAGAAVFALWALSKGAELRLKVGVSDEGLSFTYGARPAILRFAEIETLRFAPPFSERKSWLAATVLLDTKGQAWRLPVALEAGDRLVADLVRRSGREDLATWVEVLQVEQRMRRGRMHTAVVYATAAGFLIAGATFYLR